MTCTLACTAFSVAFLFLPRLVGLSSDLIDGTLVLTAISDLELWGNGGRLSESLSGSLSSLINMLAIFVFPARFPETEPDRDHTAHDQSEITRAICLRVGLVWEYRGW